MSAIDFYRDLKEEDSGTVEMHGHIFTFNNKGTIHPCGNFGGSVKSLCGSGNPPSERFESSTHTIEKRGDHMRPVEVMGQRKLCTACYYKLRKRYEMERITIAVSPNFEADKDRFREAREEVLSDIADRFK